MIDKHSRKSTIGRQALRFVAALLTVPLLLGAAGCAHGSSDALTPATHARSTSALPICDPNADSCPSGSGGGGKGTSTYYANVKSLPDDVPMNVTINNAVRVQNGGPIAMVMYQPSAFADATMTAIDQTSGAVLMTTSLSASGAQAVFGCKSFGSCVGTAVREWIIDQGLEYLKEHWHDVACATVFPSYGSCAGDVTQWVPANPPPTGTYYIPTVIMNNPGYGWIPYDPAANPLDPNNPDPVARQQCYVGGPPCGFPVNPDGTPVQPKK